MNFFKQRRDHTPETAETYWLEVYVHDFEAFMEKSHLPFWKQDRLPYADFIGYMLQPHKDDRWLYAMVGEKIIAAGLRVLNAKHFDTLEQQKADITPYFRDFPAPLEFNRDRKYIGITRFNIDPKDASDRPEQFYFLRHTLEVLDLALRARVGVLDDMKR